MAKAKHDEVEKLQKYIMSLETKLADKSAECRQLMKICEEMVAASMHLSENDPKFTTGGQLSLRSENPWPFLDFADFGRLSATCIKNVELIATHTPLAAFSDDPAHDISPVSWLRGRRQQTSLPARP